MSYGRYGVIHDCLKHRKNIVCVFQNLSELKKVIPIARKLLTETWKYEVDSYEDLLNSEIAWAGMKINNRHVILMTRAAYGCHPPDDIGRYTLAELYNKKNAVDPNREAMPGELHVVSS